MEWVDSVGGMHNEGRGFIPAEPRLRDMDVPRNRRRFLALAGTGVAASVAGCTALNSQSEPNDSSGQDDGNVTDGSDPLAGLSDAATTAVVGPDRAAQQELQALQQELAQDVRAGNISQAEMQQQLQQREREAIDAASESFEDSVEGSDDLTVEGELEGQGAYLLDGSPEAMIDALNDGEVTLLYPAEAFVTAQQQLALQEAAQAQAEANATAEGNGGNETANGGNETTDESS